MHGVFVVRKGDKTTTHQLCVSMRMLGTSERESELRNATIYNNRICAAYQLSMKHLLAQQTQHYSTLGAARKRASEREWAWELKLEASALSENASHCNPLPPLSYVYTRAEVLLRYSQQMRQQFTFTHESCYDAVLTEMNEVDRCGGIGVSSTHIHTVLIPYDNNDKTLAEISTEESGANKHQ